MHVCLRALKSLNAYSISLFQILDNPAAVQLTSQKAVVYAFLRD